MKIYEEKKRRREFWPVYKWPVSEIAAPLCTNYYGDTYVKGMVDVPAKHKLR